MKDIAKHNARVKQIGISGTCDSTVSDQAVGRHMFRDKKCSERLLPGCQDAQGCRFCVTKSGAKLDTEKSPAQWPTCPAAVCARFSLEKTDCEATLGLYTVPTFEVPEGFNGSNLPKPKLDLEATQKMQERLKLQIKAAMTGQDDPVFEDEDENEMPEEAPLKSESPLEETKSNKDEDEEEDSDRKSSSSSKGRYDDDDDEDEDDRRHSSSKYDDEEDDRRFASKKHYEDDDDVEKDDRPRRSRDDDDRR